jgi:hypothetical protein
MLSSQYSRMPNNFYVVALLSVLVLVDLSAAGIDCTGDVNDDGSVNVTDLLTVIDGWGACGDTCPADITGNGTVDVEDLLAVIGSWGDCPDDPTVGSCVLPDQSCSVMTEAECAAAGGLAWAPDGNCTDGDGDRIPDSLELGDCVGGGVFSGSDPTIADTDGDGIDDGDEVYGTLDGLYLQTFGCNPCRSDILVETDWMHSGSSIEHNRLHINQMDRLVDAFNFAPTENPDGTFGVTLHIDRGQDPYSEGNSVLDPSGDSILDVGVGLSGSEFQTVKDANFDPIRHGYFHYCLLTDSYSIAGTTTSSSGLAETPGDDFIVAMGQWVTGNSNKIGHTFMHELGHNLGLRHGGFEDLNYKPNYNSVMNYWYQMCGADENHDTIPDQRLDYSWGLNPFLMEEALFEPLGVTGEGPPIDWNVDGDTTDGDASGSEPAHRNINCQMTNIIPSAICGTHAHQPGLCFQQASQCYDIDCGFLEDHNDWEAISYAGLTDADLLPREIIHCQFSQPFSVFPSSHARTNKP